MELSVPARDATLAATLTLPSGPARAGVVALHGAAEGHRSYFLYEHLAQVLAAEGVAVLRYDRRPSRDGHDVPLETQASDALAALDHLREYVDVPTGLWGFSQGAWVAALTAVSDPVAVSFLVWVSGCGVSPADQMRVGCAKQLLEHGFDEYAASELEATRLAYEHYLRSGEGRAATQERLDWAATRPWFTHAYLPRVVPEPGSWRDMDFDPQTVLPRLTCPVLAFYGETDGWIPIDQSMAAWAAAEAAGALSDLTVRRLPGTDHLPTHGGVADATAISRDYSQTLTQWLRAAVARHSS